MGSLVGLVCSFIAFSTLAFASNGVYWSIIFAPLALLTIGATEHPNGLLGAIEHRNLAFQPPDHDLDNLDNLDNLDHVDHIDNIANRYYRYYK